MEKKTTVANFIKEYTSFTNDRVKESALKKHIFSNKYVPYEEKCAICKSIIDASTSTVVDNKRIYRQDTTARYMLYCLKMIDTYTDIIIDYQNALSEFNLLDKNDYIDLLVRSLPSVEINKMDKILKMKLDDYYENERSLAGFICKAGEKFGFVLNEFIEGFNKAIDEESANLLRETLKRKIMK